MLSGRISSSVSALNDILFVSVLISSLVTNIKLPYIHLAVSTVFIPLLSVGLIVLNFDSLGVLYNKCRGLLIILLLLYISMWCSALFSDYRYTAVKFSIKFSMYFLLFIAFLALSVQRLDKSSILAFRFLAMLALWGLIEFFFPQMWIFSVMRSTYPRISSFMVWPNQYGVLMSLGFIISIVLHRERSIGRVEILVSAIGFIAALALSGSKNGYCVLVLGLLFIFWHGYINARGLAVLLCAWVFVLIFFPISTFQLGIKDSKYLPLSDYVEYAAGLDKGPILENLSFETWIPQNNYVIPSGWFFYSEGTDASQAAFIKRSNNAKSGKYSVQMVTNKSAKYATLVYPIKRARWWRAKRDCKQIIFRAWAQSSNKYAGFSLDFQNGVWLRPPEKFYPGDGRWHELALSVDPRTIPEEWMPKFFYLHVESPSAEAFFDDVSVECVRADGSRNAPVKSNSQSMYNPSFFVKGDIGYICNILRLLEAKDSEMSRKAPADASPMYKKLISRAFYCGRQPLRNF